MDVASADIASLHGCNLLGQCICPWMDGQIFAPAISAPPPSVVVVPGQRICTGRTVVGQSICTGRTVVGQCRSNCRGAAKRCAEE